jgi:hypothetical protein
MVRLLSPTTLPSLYLPPHASHSKTAINQRPTNRSHPKRPQPKLSIPNLHYNSDRPRVNHRQSSLPCPPHTYKIHSTFLRLQRTQIESEQEKAHSADVTTHIHSGRPTHYCCMATNSSNLAPPRDYHPFSCYSSTSLR